MATIQIDIPDAEVPRVLEAFEHTFGWQGQEVDGTRAVFAKRQVAQWIRRIVRQYEIAKREAEVAAQVADPGEVSAT